MGLLDLVRQQRKVDPRVLSKRQTYPHSVISSIGDTTLMDWVSCALIYDRDACEFTGSGRIDCEGIAYFRQTLWQSYRDFCDDRAVLPCTMKSFGRRLIAATESLGWRGVHVTKANDSRRYVIRGIRFRNETRWTGEDRDQVPGGRQRHKRRHSENLGQN